MEVPLRYQLGAVSLARLSRVGELMCKPLCGSLGLPLLGPLPVSMRRTSPDADRPLGLTSFILPRRLYSSELLHFNSRPRPFGPEHYLPGFLPSSRHHRRHPTPHRRPTDRLFRPQAFSASRRFPPPSAPRAYSIPRPRPGFTVQGLLPPRSHLPSSGRDSPVSFERGLLPARAGSTVNTPRLRGFSPREDAFLGNGV